MQIICESTSKVSYRTQKRADNAAAEMEKKNKGERFSSYKCEGCGRYHIGHDTSVRVSISGPGFVATSQAYGLVTVADTPDEALRRLDFIIAAHVAMVHALEFERGK